MTRNPRSITGDLNCFPKSSTNLFYTFLQLRWRTVHSTLLSKAAQEKSYFVKTVNFESVSTFIKNLTFFDATLKQQLKKLSNHLKEVCGLKIMSNYCTKIPTPTILDWIDNKPLSQYMHHIHSYLRVILFLYIQWMKCITF